MSKSRHPVRACYAFGLLFVMGMQWFAGSIYLRRAFVVEVKDEMIAAERRIADAVMDTYGFQTEVQVVDDAQIQMLHGLGYAAPFIHSMEVDGETNAFTLENRHSRYRQIDVEIQTQRETRDDQNQALCLDRLFSQFYIGEMPFPQMRFSNVTEHHFVVDSLNDLFCHTSPSPPPWLV